ncbi:MAG: hypothetical protein RIB84_04600 [Sneathiellaceae bacterium]
MSFATQVTAIRPGAWDLSRDPGAQQPEKRKAGHEASRFAATLQQTAAGAEGPGRNWTETPMAGGVLHPALLQIDSRETRPLPAHRRG